MGVLALGDYLTLVEENLSTTSLSLRSVIQPLASCRHFYSENNKREMGLCVNEKLQTGIQPNLNFFFFVCAHNI